MLLANNMPKKARSQVAKDRKPLRSHFRSAWSREHPITLSDPLNPPKTRTRYVLQEDPGVGRRLAAGQLEGDG
jgi:hypothetical protein